MAQDARSFLMSSGKSRPAFGKPDFTIGRIVSGRIMEEPDFKQQNDYESGKPLFWDPEEKTQPKMHLIVKVQTNLNEPTKDFPEDDGVRTFFVKSHLQKAVREAVLEAGADGLAVGGILTVTYTGQGEAPVNQRGVELNPPRLYSAHYQKPAAGFLTNPAMQGGYTPPAAPQHQPAPQYQPQPQYAAPQGYPQAPQGYAPAPQGYAPAPVQQELYSAPPQQAPVQTYQAPQYQPPQYAPTAGDMDKQTELALQALAAQQVIK